MRRNSSVADLLPLSELPSLRRLRLVNVDLRRSPCLSELTQLHRLALINCCGEGRYTLSNAVFELIAKDSLLELEASFVAAARPLKVLQVVMESNSCLHTFLAAARNWSRCADIKWTQLNRLKVLALVSIQEPCKAELLALTGLEALSLAGYVYDSGHTGLAVEDFAALRMLRCALLQLSRKHGERLGQAGKHSTNWPCPCCQLAHD